MKGDDKPFPKGITERSLTKAKGLTSQKLGSWFEKETQDRLKWFQEYKPLFFHRFPDSKAAGNLISAQPADYLVTAPGNAFIVEVKASVKHSSLRSCLASNVRMEQAVKAHMWVRSGHPSLFIFIAVNQAWIEVWDGEYVSQCRRDGTRLDASKGLLYDCSALDYTNLLCTLFFKAPSIFLKEPT